MHMNRRVVAVIAAAGKGTRMGGAIPKQFVELEGIPLLARTLAVFECASVIDDIAVTVPADLREYTSSTIIAPYGLKKVKAVIPGGPDRQSSVRSALLGLHSFINMDDGDLVLIHDGARPLVTEPQIESVVAVSACCCAVLGVLSKDTVKLADDVGYVYSTPDRSSVWIVQTPQGFTYGNAVDMHMRAAQMGVCATDDAALAERLNLPVRMVSGDYTNIKVTTPDDLMYAASIIRSRAKSA